MLIKNVLICKMYLVQSKPIIGVYVVLSLFISYSVCNMLSGGTATLQPVLDGLQSTITEFIPYLVYIGLGIITATIGFVAIKWLMNWTSAKVRGTFSSRRRR